MVGESKVLSDQFNKLGIISQAEFENHQRSTESVGGEEERHEVANDDLQFELDESDKKETTLEQEQQPAESTIDNHHLHSKPTTPKKITESSIERESLYWLESNARFYPVPIRPNTAQQNCPPVSYLYIYMYMYITFHFIIVNYNIEIPCSLQVQIQCEPSH